MATTSQEGDFDRVKRRGKEFLATGQAATGGTGQGDLTPPRGPQGDAGAEARKSRRKYEDTWCGRHDMGTAGPSYTRGRGQEMRTKITIVLCAAAAALLAVFTAVPASAAPAAHRRPTAAAINEGGPVTRSSSVLARRSWLAVLLTVAVALLVVGSPSVAGAAQQQNANLYAYWNWSPAGSFGQNLDQELSIGRKASSTYWAMSWRLDNSNPGYMGLQTNGNRFDNTVGETAIFSEWGSDNYRGPSCGRFPYESGGTGYSCRLPYTIKVGAWYRLRTWKVSQDGTGAWWGAWILDESTGTDTQIGQLHIPGAGTTISQHSNFSEYFGTSVASPNAVPASTAYWTQPVADLGSSGYRYSASYAYGTIGTGTVGSVTPYGTVQTGLGTTNAVRVQQGSEGPSSGTFVWKSLKNGRCVDADLNTINVDPTRVQLWDCNNQAQQNWVVRSDGTIRSSKNGKCLDADVNNINTNGTRVQLWTCNGSRQQQWAITGGATGSSHQLVNQISNRCVDADLNTIQNVGTKIQLWDCNGQPQQAWQTLYF